MPDRHGGYSKHMLCFRCGPICSFQIFYVMRLVQFYNQWEMVLNYKPAFRSEKQEATSGWQQKGSRSKIWNKEPHVRGWLKTPRAACFLVNTWVQPHIFCTQEIIYKGLCVKLFHKSKNSHWMRRPMSFRAFKPRFGLEREHCFSFVRDLYKCKSPERMFREEKTYRNVFLAG